MAVQQVELLQRDREEFPGIYNLFEPRLSPDGFSPSERRFAPNMTFDSLVTSYPEVAAEALRLFSGGGLWMGGSPTVDLEALRQRTGKDESRYFYTPGVGAPTLKLAELHLAAQQENTPEAWEAFYEGLDRLTPKFRRVAVVTNSTRVLGLGDVGPYGGYMVMSGKILLFNLLGGLWGEPHMLTSTDPDEMVRWVLNGQVAWGAVNLEDIRNPDCYYILDELRKTAEIAVWHDDQQGTGEVVLAGLLNALKVVGKLIDRVRIVFVGYGAANTKTSEYVWAAGADPENCLCLDTGGIIHLGRKNIDWTKYPNKRAAADLTNPKITGGPAEALRGADVLIALSAPGAVTVEQIAEMADKAIVFLCANPIPEANPYQVAQLGNVAVVGTGRSDFSNQINNSLVFPGTLAGAMFVGAMDIRDRMVVAGAHALASQLPNPTPDMILPQMTLSDMRQTSPAIAQAVATVATNESVARLWRTPEQVYETIRSRIEQAQGIAETLARAALLRR